jgi:uncharacterized protein YbjT (DUF2867 family)
MVRDGRAPPRYGGLDMATAWLAGGSGLVGGVLLRRLLEDGFFTKVVSTGRRVLPREHPKLLQTVVDFSAPGAFDALDAPEVAFCCLGTTMKKAGSRKAFREVDYGAVLAFAQAAHGKGARVFVHVSSLGADPSSRIFYSSVKGQIEEAVARLGFTSVTALRPSMIDGRREERRTAERIGLRAMRAVGPLLGKYRPTPVEAIAQAMVAAGKVPSPGARVLEADAILRMSVAG